MAAEDDEALTWGGDRDPTHVEGQPASPVEPDGTPLTTSATSSVLLVAYGVFGGVYLLYIVGWVIGVQRDTFTSGNLFFEIMYQFGEFLAICSPVLWFGLVLILTRGRRAVIRVLWLVVGILLLAPWPFILSGSAA